MVGYQKDSPASRGHEPSRGIEVPFGHKNTLQMGWGVNFCDDEMCGKCGVRGRKEVFFVNFRAFERRKLM